MVFNEFGSFRWFRLRNGRWKGPTLCQIRRMSWCKDMFSRFGVLETIHSDQGRNFESKVFATMCEHLGARKTRTTPLRPLPECRVSGKISPHLGSATGYSHCTTAAGLG